MKPVFSSMGMDKSNRWIECFFLGQNSYFLFNDGFQFPDFCWFT